MIVSTCVGKHTCDVHIGFILGGMMGTRTPTFCSGVPYLPLFKSCHKKNYDANPSV